MSPKAECFNCGESMEASDLSALLVLEKIHSRKNSLCISLQITGDDGQVLSTHYLRDGELKLDKKFKKSRQH